MLQMSAVSGRINFFVNLLFILLFLVSSPSQGAEEENEEEADEIKKLDPIHVQSVIEEGYNIPNTSSATRTNTSLRDIPKTIYVLPKNLLRDQNAQSFTDAMRNVPGVMPMLGEGDRDEATIRGIVTEYDFYMNGMPDTSQYFRDPYNVEHIDVLKGAAGMIYGRNDGGGIINRVTKQPTSTPQYNLNLNYGYWNHKRTTIDLGGPIPLGDMTTYRFNAMAQDSGSFRDDFFIHRYGVDPEIGFQIDDNTKLTVGMQYLNDRRLVDRGIPGQNGKPADVPISEFFGSPTQNNTLTVLTAAHGIFEHQINESLKIQNSFRFTNTEKIYANIFPTSAVSNAGTVTMFGYNDFDNRDGFFNRTDIIYDVDTGPIHQKILGGMFLSYENDRGIINLASAAPGSTFTVSVLNPNVVGVFNIPSKNIIVNATDISLFFQDQIEFTKNWKMIVGARWDNFRTTATNFLPNNGPNVDHLDTMFSPQLGLTYQPNDIASFYISYSQAHAPQANNLAFTIESTDDLNLAPLVATNYEMGAKFNILEDKLSVNVALFRLEQENINNPDPTNPLIVVQTGKQQNEGFEVSAAGEILPKWQIFGGYTSLNAHILTNSTETLDTVTNATAGAVVGLVPQNQFNLWSTYDFTSHFGIGAGVLGRSSMFTSFTNTQVLPGYAIANAMAYYQHLNYRVSLNFDNIGDARYYSTAITDNQIMPGAPFNVMANFTASF
ncbi:TonB-dependent receptor [Candidatus Nitrosacidococcus tergens]|uniref:Putative TonB-dependent receptor n=1 Tax=Candidatus Nitrosacidococcus tergens TaxID=553981 RepID=A0A7G1QBF8_9GAMM|nr:TonB-dependent siderophore receptor [Candidatus Nitrosacidococcus tergens]CAB1277387.1 putative TonB-dependent receptor [Candidatus Nitrosacidococcus tergens]